MEDYINPINKPPRGLKPKYIHKEERLWDIINASTSYMQEARTIPKEWVEEYNELTQDLKPKKEPLEVDMGRAEKEVLQQKAPKEAFLKKCLDWNLLQGCPIVYGSQKQIELHFSYLPKIGIVCKREEHGEEYAYAVLTILGEFNYTITSSKYAIGDNKFQSLLNKFVNLKEQLCQS